MGGRCPKFFRPPPKNTQDMPRSATGQHPRGERKNGSTRKKSAQRRIESPHARARRPLRRNAQANLRPANASFHPAIDLHGVDGTPTRTGGTWVTRFFGGLESGQVVVYWHQVTISMTFARRCLVVTSLKD